MINLDLDFVRRQFPATYWSSGWALMENAGGSVVPNQVVDALTHYMTHNQVQPGAPYPAGQDAQEQMDRGHALMAEMIGADLGEVMIGPSTSINVYVLANALRPLWNEGDEVIVSIANHEANSSPWRRLAKAGIAVRDWPVLGDSGSLDLDALPGLLTDRTRLVAFPHVSNITGEVNDVQAIAKTVHDAGGSTKPLVCVDGVAYAPHRAIDVKAWDADFYLFSFYKVMGPHMGCLYGKRDLLVQARGQGHDFFPEDDIHHKLNPAGPQHEMIASLGGIADYFEALAAHHGIEANGLRPRTLGVFDLIQAHEERLSAAFLDGAKDLPGMRVLGTDDPARRAPTFSFTVEGKTSAEVAGHLAAHNLGASHGDFYAPRILRACGIDDTTDGVCRASLVHYNSMEEVGRLVGALQDLA